MNWGAPWVLLALPLPWLLLRRSARRSASGTLRQVGVVRGRVGPTEAAAPRRRWLLSLALCLGLLALARPRWGVAESSGEEPAREVLIALDLSRSMLVADVAPTRLQRAHAVIGQLLHSLQGERVGLIVFAGVAFMQVPLSSDQQIIREFLPSLEPGYLPRGGSDYAGMLRTVADGFSAEGDADRYLFVLSDGESTTEGWESLADQLARRGVMIIGLGVGTEQGGPVPAIRAGDASPGNSHLEPATLRALAERSHGLYRNVSEASDLTALVAATTAQGRKVRAARRASESVEERYAWFLVPAWIAGLLALGFEIPKQAASRSIRRQTLIPLAQTGAVLVAVLLVGALMPRLVHAHDTGHEYGAEVTAAERLQWVVQDLARHPSIDHRDVAILAERTIAYAVDTLAKGQTPPEGALRDALAAVDYGERHWAKAEDWPALRTELQRFLARRADSNALAPTQKKEALDEEDRPTQTNGQGSQQSTSDSMGQSGVAKTEATLGALNKETVPRFQRRPSRPGGVQAGNGVGDAVMGTTADPMRAVVLRHLHEVIKADTPGDVYQVLNGASEAAAGGKDW